MSKPVFADNRLAMLEEIVANNGVCECLRVTVEFDTENENNYKIIGYRCLYYGGQESTQRQCTSDSCPRLIEAEKADDTNAENHDSSKVIKLEFGDRR
jgi:hypothetical protein